MKSLRLTIFFLFAFYFVFSQKNDSIHLKVPKHYFQNTILFDYYQKPKVTLPPSDDIRSKLKSNQIKQSIVAVSIPVFTEDFIKKDSSVSNINFLLTGYFLSFNPNFSGLENNHYLKKNGIGFRFIYNNGKKSIFFIDVSPFSTFDKNFRQDTRVIRMASLLLWSYSPSEKFNFRLGLTKSFMWGNRFYLPVIGFRFGRYDKINFSFQFPRIVSLNFPITNKFQISLFTKPQGGLFSISNADSIYKKFINENKVIYLGRYEFLGGLRIDVKPLKWLAFYISAGKTVNNFLALYSLHFNKNRQFEYGSFFQDTPAKSPFINFGITTYFGKTKSYYEQKNIDEMLHLNNQTGVGDNNTQVYQQTDNFKKKEKFKVTNQEISDLINTFDY
ncbi:MAG TPA: hypothetical protein PK995_01880 [Bacteroidia bacterium]|nr:hypothetical protein [Bacteroidia bacterium]